MAEGSAFFRRFHSAAREPLRPLRVTGAALKTPFAPKEDALRRPNKTPLRFVFGLTRNSEAAPVFLEVIGPHVRSARTYTDDAATHELRGKPWADLSSKPPSALADVDTVSDRVKTYTVYSAMIAAFAIVLGAIATYP
jgi:hypothetical protein